MSYPTEFTWTTRDDHILMAVLPTAPLHLATGEPDLMELTKSMNSLSSSLFRCEAILYPPYSFEQASYGLETRLPELLETFPLGKIVCIYPPPAPKKEKVKWCELDDRLLMQAYFELGREFNPGQIACRMNELVAEHDLPRLRVYHEEGIERVLRKRGFKLVRAAESERKFDEREFKAGMENDWGVFMCEYLGWTGTPESVGFEVEHIEYASGYEPEPYGLFFGQESCGMIEYSPEWEGEPVDFWFAELALKLETVALEQRVEVASEEAPDMVDW